jgi:hypothetical protein
MARLRREHHRMLGDGWCTRPPELDCAFESICETCTFFQSSIEFRPALAAQRDDANARHQILDQAIDQLARLRTTYWLGDSGVRLHALASLIAQAEQLLPLAVHDARDQELTWAEIGELLGIADWHVHSQS